MLASKLVAYGVAMGIGAEAVVLASALSQPKPLFRTAHPVVHTDPDEYNSIVYKSFCGQLHFDQGIYSDPMMLLNIFLQWRDIQARTKKMKKGVNQNDFYMEHNIVHSKLRYFYSSTKHLLSYVNEELDSKLDLMTIPSPLSGAVVNRLRLILLWAFRENVIVSGAVKVKADVNTLVIKNQPLKDACLEALFPFPIAFTRKVIERKRAFELAAAPFINFKEMESCAIRTFMDGMQANGFVLMVGAADKEFASDEDDIECMVDMLDAILICNALVDNRGDITLDVPALLSLDDLIHSVSLTTELIELPAAASDEESDERSCTFVVRIRCVYLEDVQIVENLIVAFKSAIVHSASMEQTNLLLMNLDCCDAVIQSIVPHCDADVFKLTASTGVDTVITFADQDDSQALFRDLPLGKRLFNAYCAGNRNR